jgi:hypothetical protein
MYTEVIIATEGGLITSCTEASLMMFGVKQEQLIGKPIESLFLSMEKDETGIPWYTQVYCADGSTLEAVCECNAVANSNIVVSQKTRIDYVIGDSNKQQHYLQRYRITNNERQGENSSSNTSDDDNSRESTSFDDMLSCVSNVPSVESSLGLYKLEGILGEGAFGSVR